MFISVVKMISFIHKERSGGRKQRLILKPAPDRFSSMGFLYREVMLSAGLHLD